ncbi:hypothetical protein ACN47E_000486 [Coniothyrium glycines]
MVRSRQPELYVAALLPYTAAAVALVLRMVARRKTRVSLVWEDYTAIVAFVVGSGFTFLSLFKMRWGLGIRLADIDLPKEYIVHHYFLELWVDMWLYTFSVGLSKFVVLGLYWRLFSLSIIRQPIRILFACSVAWIIARVLLILLQCQPIRKFWDNDSEGHCPLKPMMALFGAGIPHFILEVAILLCPLIEVWRLHMGTTKKIAVSLIFASGLLVCISALGTIVNTAGTAGLNSKKPAEQDLTWDGLNDQIWAVCDVNLASFATSLPLLRPVFRSFGGVFGGLRSSGTALAGSGNVLAIRTFGSAPSAPRSRARKSYLSTESIVEFADDDEEEEEDLESAAGSAGGHEREP